MHTYHICILTSQYIKSILPKYILYRVFLTIDILGTTPLKKFHFEIDVTHTFLSIQKLIRDQFYRSIKIKKIISRIKQ